MFQHALAPIAQAFGDASTAERYDSLASDPVGSRRRFWSDERGLFVNNLPWLDEEQAPRLCDRSLATAILYDQCPGGRRTAEARARWWSDRPSWGSPTRPTPAGATGRSRGWGGRSRDRGLARALGHHGSR